jgi:hypothetical protein
MLEGIVGLDSLGPSVYIIFGLVWIIVSRLARRRALSLSLPSQVEDVGKGDGAAVVLGKKVVPINRSTRISRRVTFPRFGIPGAQRDRASSRAASTL